MDTKLCALPHSDVVPDQTSDSRLQNLLSTLPKLACGSDTKPALDSEFTCFPNLPPELRSKVWKAAANNEPRTVCIHTLSRPSKKMGARPYRRSLRVNDCNEYSAVIPGILLACKESRGEALPFYEIYEERSESGHKRKIYLNFNIDRFIMSEHNDSGIYESLRSRYPYTIPRNFDDAILGSMQNLIRRCHSREGTSLRFQIAEMDTWTQAKSLRLVLLSEFSVHYEIDPWSSGSTLVSEEEETLDSELERKDNELSKVEAFRAEYDYITDTTNPHGSSPRIPTPPRSLAIEWVKSPELDIFPVTTDAKNYG